MPDDRKKMFSKKGTGTVPKVKHRNNTSCTNQGDFQRNLSNNLGLDWQQRHHHDYSNYSRNSERNYYQLNPFPMETPFTDDHRQNGIGPHNVTANGTLSTSSTSGSNSRRDSMGTIPKCDNVKKCPDKKRIEDKLNQIREYLRVTTSLMSSIKNTDDQSAMKEKEDFERMIKDLKDSEAKLLVLLSDPFYNDMNDEEPIENGTDNASEPGVSGYQRNALEEKVEFTNRKVQLLREQQNALINLKQKAENQLREAQQAQENLLMLQQQKPKLEQLAYSEPQDKNLSVIRFDVAIKELEEKLESMRNDPRPSALSSQDNPQVETDYINDQLENSNHLLHILDNRDSLLNSEHIELQQKFTELQSKKLQIDQLAQQLQNLGDEDDEDIGNQVRKIVTMKQQLSSLKDLLEIVKNTEFSLLDSQNVNELIDSESQDTAHGICMKTDNIRQDVRSNRNHNENGLRLETNASRTNEQWLEKQSNKSMISLQEKEKVLAELKAKKRELEEIMYKQKDRTSINNDVCSEASANKSDMSANNMFDGVVMSWLPVQPNQHNQIASVYSSDECPEEDINEYSDLNSATEATAGSIAQAQPSIISNFSSSSYNKHRTASDQRLDPRNHPGDYVRRVSPAIPEPRNRTVSSATFERERTGSNSISEADTTTLQKQLEMIHNVCQSLLDQQTSNNIQQLRNNLMYSDPHSYVQSNARQIGVNGHNEIPPYVTNSQQCFGLGDVANNQNILAANTLQTQAFLLNTLNQCCQMLWFQQREIATLRNMICTMQDQMINGQIEQDVNSSVQPPSSSYIFPARPTSSLSNFRAPSQPRNVTNPPKVNQACSLPNLNPSPLQQQHTAANIESAYLNQSNIRSSPSARLLESSLNNATTTAQIHHHSHHNLSGGGGSEQNPANNAVLPSVNINAASISQPLPSQIWNGQALNNQVAPGNRANNYWDNFRSYSRQNLLSTSSKSNEGLQHSASVLERSNTTTYDRSQSFPLPPHTSPKLNTVHNNESASASEESTPRRHLHFKPSQNISTSNKSSISAAIPPDVLNINHNMSQQKTNEHHHQELMDSEGPLDLNIPGCNLVLDVNGMMGDSRIYKDYSAGSVRNRNEWHHDNDHSDNLPKSKLFEELRDNVYKEVANLISANESRPHFLIQLFRDLQQINSDPLRGRTLQSIQTVITNSLNVLENTRGASRQSASAQQTTSEQELAQVDSESYSLQHSIWSQSPASTSRDSCTTTEVENVENPDIYNVLKTIFAFLKTHDDDILHQELIELLKGIIVKVMPFSEIFGNSHVQERTFHKHFLAILNDLLEKYQGGRIAEIKKDLLKSLSDLLIGEFSFIYLIQENLPENCEVANPLPANSNALPSLTSDSIQKQPNKNIVVENGTTPQMQNGDLAEADQSCAELQEEEGAVGGVLNMLGDSTTTVTAHIDLVDSNATEVPKIEFPINAESEIEFAEQGLDQVPTRLTTHSRSNSNTPSRDRSNSSRSDPMEHF